MVTPTSWRQARQRRGWQGAAAGRDKTLRAGGGGEQGQDAKGSDKQVRGSVGGGVAALAVLGFVGFSTSSSRPW
jgi:hypothetical protein